MRLFKTKHSIILPILILSLSGSAVLVTISTGVQQQGFAVIELFTSEGCSSCPPADDAMAEIEKKYKENVYVLSYHIDYWDNLGWKDEFSKSNWSARQRHYVSLLRLNSMYTPQVIVNGKSEFVGSDRSLLQSNISKELKNSTNHGINITAHTEANRVVINYKIADPGPFELNIALVQIHARTSVKRGENEGKILNHFNVVRDMQYVDAGKPGAGSINMQLPAGLSREDCSIIGFLQEKNNWHITGARQIAIL